MNREDIICMAQEAGAIPIHKNYSQKALVGNENIERFAVLVASAERDEIIKIANDLRYWDDSESLIKAIQARGSDAEAN